MRKFTLLLFFILPIVTSTPCFAQEIPVGMWRITSFNNNNYTLIAVSDKIVTYEVCRTGGVLYAQLSGKVSPFIDGTVSNDLEFPVGSCMILSGKKIGLYANEPPQRFLHYSGTFKRIDPEAIWSSKLDWRYEAKPAINDSFYFRSPVAKGRKGLYRICQTYIMVGDNDPDPYEVGFHLWVDGQQITIAAAGTLQFRLARGSCVDVSGSDVSVQFIKSEIQTGRGYSGVGWMHYALDKLP
jgi:hypothetical protein